MSVARQPENDFARFIDIYYQECRQRFPTIECIGGKWEFEDLIPGLSDFDTRFIVRDGMTVRDWCEMSSAVGEVHLDMCRRFPHWARNLEHLPGINLMWQELVNPGMYYPEYPQWTFYKTSNPARLAAAEQYLSRRPWDAKDEYFHLKKFCLYFGRYDRKIDPPVNLGPYENKYPLHSRFMHYFCPPLQSALCVLFKRPIRGKLETVHLACERFPDVPVFAEMRKNVEQGYEAFEHYQEPEMTLLEDRLEKALEFLKGQIAPHLTLIPDPVDKTVLEWKACLARVPQQATLRVFEASRFSRLMKGRLRFYAMAPAHFDSSWPIENELRRMRRNFFEIPFGAFFELYSGRPAVDPLQHMSSLPQGLLTDHEIESVHAFYRLLPASRQFGNLRDAALAVSLVFDGFFSALVKISEHLKTISAKTRKL